MYREEVPVLITTDQIEVGDDCENLEDLEDAEERAWDDFFNHPETQAFFQRLTEETQADIAAGRIKKWRTSRFALLSGNCVESDE